MQLTLSVIPVIVTISDTITITLLYFRYRYRKSLSYKLKPTEGHIGTVVVRHKIKHMQRRLTKSLKLTQNLRI